MYNHSLITKYESKKNNLPGIKISVLLKIFVSEEVVFSMKYNLIENRVYLYFNRCALFTRSVHRIF